jgi:putative ABC transport system permease protein
MLTLLHKVRRDVRRRPLRNLLTLVGIVLGVAGVVAISSTARTLVEAQRLTYDGSRQADLATFAEDISETTADLVARQPNVSEAETRSVVFTRFTTGERWENLRLVGINDFSAMQLNVVELVRGRFPGSGEIAFDTSTRELTAVDIGDVVAIRTSPDKRSSYLTVVGLTSSPARLGAGLMNQATAYAPADIVRDLAGQSADNFLLIRVSDPERASQTAEDVRELLAKRAVTVSGFDVRDPGAFVGSRELGTLLLLLRLFSYLGAALAAVLVGNTLAAVMSEETGQIGIIKSLGGRRRHVVATYLLYGSILGLLGTLIGWAAGLVLGRAISRYLTDLTGLQQPDFAIRPREIVLALLVGASVTVTTSIVPVIIRSGERVAVLLRSPGVRSERGSSLLRRLSDPFGGVSVAAVLGMRNALRRPARTASTLIVVTVAVAAFISTQALSRSVSGTVDELYELYGADGWIYFQQPVDLGFAAVLQREPSVTQAEPWTSATGAIGSVRTDIWGMPEHDPLYSFRLVHGRWVHQSNPPSVVLTTNLADAIDARVGDALPLDVGAARETVRVSGIVDDSSTYLGNTSTGKVFMTVGDVNRLRGLGRQAEIFALTLTSSDPADVDAAMAALEERTREHGPVTYSTYADQRSSRKAIGVLTLMLNAMVIVVAVVGIAGIANTLLISIAERRRELGVLRALGAGSRQMVLVLVSEGVMLAIIGLIAGTAAGYPLARLLVRLTSAQLFELRFHLSPVAVAATFVVAILAVAAVSTVPGIVASRIRPIHVLRYE